MLSEGPSQQKRFYTLIIRAIAQRVNLDFCNGKDLSGNSVWRWTW